MIYLLVGILVGLLIMSLYVGEKDVLSPFTISVSVFLISSFFAMLNMDKWGVTISGLCVFVVTAGLLAVGAGEITINKLFAKYPLVDDQKTYDNEDMNAPIWITIIFIVILLFGAWTVFKKTYEISLQAGNPDGISSMLQYARTIMITPGNHLGQFCNHLTIFSQAVAYVYLYIILRNLFYHCWKWWNCIYFIPVVLYVMTDMLGTGRAFMIQLIAYILVISVLLWKKNNPWTVSDMLKIMALGAFFLALYCVIWLALGSMRGGDYSSGVFDALSKYIGTSIPDLSEFLDREKTGSVYIGQETLYGVHNVLRKLGMDLPDNARHLESGVLTNVYTSLRRYIHDFGYMGMLVLQVYIGMLYTTAYQLAKRYMIHQWLIIVFGWLFYPLVMQSIDDMLLSSYIYTTSVYWLFYLGVVYYILIGRGNGRKFKKYN